MSIADRTDMAQQQAVEDVFSSIDKAWSAAENGFYQAANGVRDAGGYVLNHPMEAVQSVGDFAEDAVRRAWDIQRELVGNGLLWANTVRQLFQTPCEDKWSVLIETALPAIGNAMWLFIVPSPNEILENYLQPYPTKEGRRRTRGSDPDGRRRGPSGRKRRAWPGVPDVDEMIASMLPGAHAVKGRDAGNGTRWLFEAIDLADAVGWHFMLVDASNDVFLNWSSGIMQARFCEKPAYFLFQSNQRKPRYVRAVNTTPITYQTVTTSKNTQVGFGYVNLRFPGGADRRARGMVTAYLELSKLLSRGESRYARLRLEVLNQNNQRRDYFGEWGFLTDGGGTSVNVFAEVEDVLQFRLHLEYDIGSDYNNYLYIQAGAVFATLNRQLE